jgi:hypothetical protein
MAIEPGPQWDGKDFDPADFGFKPGEAEDTLRNARNEHNADVMKRVEETFFGPGGSFKTAVQQEAAHRLRHMPDSHVNVDDDGLHVAYTAGGWTTKWWGGKYAEHSHPKHGVVDVTDMAIRMPDGDEHLPTELNIGDIKNTHHEFLSYKTENYPKHMQ